MNRATGKKKAVARKAVDKKPVLSVGGSKRHVKFEEESSTGEPEKKDLSSPEFCSILKLADDIRKVQLHTDSEFVKSELSKCSKKVNLDYEPDERLYKDLVSVGRPVTESQQKVKHSSSTRISAKKDPEPDLKETLKYTLQSEYLFLRFTYPEVKKATAEFDGLSVYNISQRYTVYNTY